MQLAIERARQARAGRRRDAGQSLVEFALILPVFVLLLAGMIDFGLGLYSYMTLQTATREGARLGVTDCTASDCATAVTNRTRGAASGMTVSVSVACTSPAGAAEACTASKSGDSVTVSVNYTYQMIWPLTFGTQIPMTSSITMMID